MFEWQDLREWLEAADRLGELRTLEGVDSNLELSAIAQVNARNLGPAILFNKIIGYEKTGFRVLTNSIANEKLFGLTFGHEPGTSLRDEVELLRGKPNQWERESENFPVREVTKASFLKNVDQGEKLNLLKFPAPLWHKKDGGPFLGSGVAVITKDLETGKINVGSYRAQLYDRSTVGFNAEKGKHGAAHRDGYFAKQERMPVVLVFGPDPLLYLLAGSEIPTGISELEYEGAIRGEPIDVVRGKYTGLPIPANCEIAVEGFIDKEKTKLEGPHGEWLGYYSSGAKEKPFVDVKAAYYRNDAIILGAAMSKGSYNDHAYWRSIWKSSLIYDEMVKNGIPNVRGVYSAPFGVGRQFIIVSIKQSYPGHATEAAYFASQTRSAAYMGKWVVVVDDDVNPYDIEDVLWAVSVRADPSDIGIIRKGWASAVDPLRPANIPSSSYTNNRGIIYAVVPYERLSDFPEKAYPDEDERKHIFDKWSSEMNGRWSKH